MEEISYKDMILHVDTKGHGLKAQGMAIICELKVQDSEEILLKSFSWPFWFLERWQNKFWLPATPHQQHLVMTVLS